MLHHQCRPVKTLLGTWLAELESGAKPQVHCLLGLQSNRQANANDSQQQEWFWKKLYGKINIKDNHEPKSMRGNGLRKIQKLFSSAPSSNFHSRSEAD